jgi:PAS domain-containing protein
MSESSSLARPEIQSELLSEALRSASVGFLVWDEDRRYIAANRAACEILGTTLEELLGQRVADHTVQGAEALEESLVTDFSTGLAVVERFDGRGRVDVFYATFATRTAGMPFMATLLAAVDALK